MGTQMMVIKNNLFQIRAAALCEDLTAVCIKSSLGLVGQVIPFCTNIFREATEANFRYSFGCFPSMPISQLNSIHYTIPLGKALCNATCCSSSQSLKRELQEKEKMGNANNSCQSYQSFEQRSTRACWSSCNDCLLGVLALESRHWK